MVISKDAKIGNLYFAKPDPYSSTVFLAKLLKSSRKTYAGVSPTLKLLLRFEGRSVFYQKDVDGNWTWDSLYKLNHPKFKIEYTTLFGDCG